jgi:putative MATE family efflux protein
MAFFIEYKKRKESLIMSQLYMKEKPVLPLVLSMSFPMAISMLVNALYNIVDSYFVAKISESAMTALSLVFPLQNLVMAVAVGFGVGINAAAAYFLGAENPKAADQSVSQGLILNGLHGILLTAGCLSSARLFLGLFTSDAETLSYGTQYSYIVFLFSVVITVGVCFEKIFQAVGRMKVSMAGMMIGCLANIILDPILIFGIGFFPELGIKGAALATGIGQGITLVFYIIVFLKTPMPVRIRIERSMMDSRIRERLYAVGIPATLNMALPSLLITALNGILAEFSQTHVLVLGIYYKLQTFIYLTTNGIVQGIRPLVGYNYGAGELGRVKRVHGTALLLSALIMALGTGLCLALPKQLIGLFSSNPQTIAAGIEALRFISCGFLVSAISVITCGTLEGLGKGLPSLVISIIRYIALIPIAFALSRVLQATGVWHAFWVTELIGAAVSILLFHHCMKQLPKGTA